MKDSFPFRLVLTLDGLIDHWRRAAEREGVEGALAARLLEQLEEAPELVGPIEDLALLDRHADLVAALMSAIFAPAAARDSYGAALTPLSLDPIHVTPGFQRMGLLQRVREKLTTGRTEAGRIMVAYQYVLSAIYDTPIDIVMSGVIPAIDPDTGLERFYRLEVDWRFCKAVAVGTPPALTQTQIERLLADRTNLELWAEALPPQTFELHGFTIFHVRDVTEQHVIASLTSDLLRPDAMAARERVDLLQSRLRTLLRRPALDLGLISIDRDEKDAITGARAVGKSLLLSRGAAPHCCNSAESYYTEVMETHEPVFVHDLACCARVTPYESHVHEQGMRNLVIAPLLAGERLVGIIELASPNPGDLHVLNAGRIEEVLGLFATAMKRMLDDRETRIQAVIKQQYTAIHPAVEWRFRKAARHYIDLTEDGEYTPPEPIVFPEVYPLYGLSDVRSSSTHRSDAIQSDLLEQLALARAVVDAAHRERALPVLAELQHRLERASADVASGLRSGDELRVLDLLRTELEEIFRELADFGQETVSAIERYHQSIDPALGFLYRQRRAFEQSITIINDTISAVIDREEARAQEMSPHYFEKFKTDGVDYSIYMGASLQEDGRFQSLYLRNLRIWQLMMMCAVVWELRRTESRLAVPLEVAHLILVQSAPLAIRFRPEEKKFDVDGAYNIRYEIVKKRIDKARLRATREHLTQPGRLAIVYSHPREAAEYRQYVEFLHASGYLTADIEELELEDLQGARGLQALRVTVAPEAPSVAPAAIIEAASVLQMSA